MDFDEIFGTTSDSPFTKTPAAGGPSSDLGAMFLDYIKLATTVDDVDVLLMGFLEKFKDEFDGLKGQLAEGTYDKDSYRKGYVLGVVTVASMARITLANGTAGLKTVMDEYSTITGEHPLKGTSLDG
jgi:hypothetical protein